MTRGLARLRCNFDLQDWEDEPIEAETIIASLEDLAASAAALGGEALSAYVWLVDRVTAHPDIRDRLLKRRKPGAIAAVLPTVKEPVRAWRDAAALDEQRRWPETIERLTAAQQGLAALGFVCFASRIDLDLADCHIRLGQLQQARLLLDRWDAAVALHMSPWTPGLEDGLDDSRRAHLAATGRHNMNPEREYMRLYPVFLNAIYRQRLLDALVTDRLGDPRGALRTLGPLDEIGQLMSFGSNAWFDVASILRDAGRLEQALAITENALADPESADDGPRAENLRGTLLLALDRPRDAQHAFRRVAKAARRRRDSYGVAVAQVNLASALVQRAQPERALAELQGIREDIQAAPGRLLQNWHTLAAMALEALGRFDEAEAAVLEAVKLSENSLATLQTADLQTAWQGGSRGLYDLAVNIAMLAHHTGKALELVELARSRALLFQLASPAPGAAPPPAAVSPDAADVTVAVAALVNRRRVLARLLAAARQGGRVEPELLSELQQIRVEVQAVTDTPDPPPQATAATPAPAAGGRFP